MKKVKKARRMIAKLIPLVFKIVTPGYYQATVVDGQIIVKRISL